MSEPLGDLRVTQLHDDDLPTLQAVTALSVAAIRKRVNRVHGNVLLRNVFADRWPVEPDELGTLSVSVARRAGLELELQGATGLGVRAVRNRLEKEHGKTLLANAFPELARAAGDGEPPYAPAPKASGQGAEEGADPYLDPARSFAWVDLLGAARLVAVRDDARLLDWLGTSLGMSSATARRRARDAHGRTSLRAAYAQHWSARAFGEAPRELLGALSCASALRSSSLVRLVADLARVSPEQALDALQRSPADGTVGSVLPAVIGPARRVPSPPGRTPARPPAPASVAARSRSTPARPGTLSGEVVGGRYRLGRVLGQGGFGQVYEAENVEAPELRVVVKIGLPDKRESLRDEMSNAFSLNHPNICSYKDIGTDPQRGTFLVMQHGGTSLEQVLKDQGPLSPEQAFEVAAQIAAGLDHAHKKKTIHHDIKPANVLIDVEHQPWEVRITDFGIAVKGRAVKNTDGKSTLSATHPRGQSLAYSAPEQLRGDRSTWRSDQYSLGLVVCSMLTGQVLKGHHPPKPLPMLSQAQNRALMKALSEDPVDRFHSCAEFVAALRA